MKRTTKQRAGLSRYIVFAGAMLACLAGFWKWTLDLSPVPADTATNSTRNTENVQSTNALANVPGANEVVTLDHPSQLLEATGSLENYYRDSWKTRILEPADPEALDVSNHLFERWFTGKHPLNLIRDWESIGFEVVGFPSFLSWPENRYHSISEFEDDDVWAGFEGIVITEKESIASGQGVFALRRRAKELVKNPILLMIPHRNFDMYTGEIGLKLFQEGPFLAAVWNTFPRYEDGTDTREWQDLARREDSFLNTMALSFMKVFPNGKTLQIHGYGRDSRATAEGKLADAIVSDGTREPDPAVRRFTAQMEETLGVRCRLYPDEVRELGATTNVTGKQLRSQGTPGLVHVEMARIVRERMKDSAEFRARFLEALPALFE